jgi:hypothetical protein
MVPESDVMMALRTSLSAVSACRLKEFGKIGSDGGQLLLRKIVTAAVALLQSSKAKYGKNNK